MKNENLKELTSEELKTISNIYGITDEEVYKPETGESVFEPVKANANINNGKTLDVLNRVLKAGYEYEISSFGPRQDPIAGIDSFHNGVDVISSKYGTDQIVAIQDGIVEAVRDAINGFDKSNASGNYVFIKHDEMYQTRYLHLKEDSITVKVGQTVKKGDIIANMGSTGYCTGNHLHFEVRFNGNPQDPTPYLSGEKTISQGLSRPKLNRKPKSEYRVGDIVDFKGGYHYINSQAGVPTGDINEAGKAKITGLAEGKKHPYHLIGTVNGSDVYGWVDAATIGVTSESDENNKVLFVEISNDG